MISQKSFTKEWIMGIREKSFGKDAIIIEKMIMALTLVENLRVAGMNFVFKGGTALTLMLKTPLRFSIDIDIILPHNQLLENCFQEVLHIGVFKKYQEDLRDSVVPIRHFKFYFDSIIEGKESSILLDILFEENPYAYLQEIPIASSFLVLDGEAINAFCPTYECLLGDKLTAFAPHTTGIQFKKNKEIEMAKQLFDVAALFDLIEDASVTRKTYLEVVRKELSYRRLEDKTHIDVLLDTFKTSCMIGMRG